jgi:putative ABC transport system permease protein
VSFFEAVRIALTQIRVQKLKSFFTITGVMIGVMFLIAVVSVVEGMGQYMEHDLVGKIMSLHTFELRTRPDFQMGDVDESVIADWRRRPRITEDDIHPVTDALPPGTRWYVVSQDQVTISSAPTRPQRVPVYAVTGDYFTIRSLGVTTGRVFTPQELESGGLVIVIGQDVKDRFFANVDPVGHEIKMGGIPYTVVGVAEKQGSTFGISLDKFVIAPYRSPVHRLLNRERGVIDAIVVQAQNDIVLADAEERVRQVMRTRHRLHPSQPDNFSLQTPEAALTTWRSFQRYLVLAAIILPAIGLVVGAIVIMNIMLIAVAERTHEIGIRKSLGARRRDILAQFLIESASLSLMGAAAGIALGVGLAEIVTRVTPMPVSVVPWSIGMAVALGAGVGIVSGVYPATRAAQLDPIAALRQE